MSTNFVVENGATLDIAIWRDAQSRKEQMMPDVCVALQRSLLPGVTARTHKHNRGFGLDNIVSTMTSKDTMRILSNDALLFKSQNKEEVVPLPYDFKGTLIDFTISTDGFDELEIIEELNFG